MFSLPLLTYINLIYFLLVTYFASFLYAFLSLLISHIYYLLSLKTPVLAAAPDRPPDFYPPIFILHATRYLHKYFLIISFPYYTITLLISYLYISRNPPILIMFLPVYYHFYNYSLRFFCYICISVLGILFVSITTPSFPFYSIFSSYFFITHLSSLQLQTYFIDTYCFPTRYYPF